MIGDNVRRLIVRRKRIHRTDRFPSATISNHPTRHQPVRIELASSFLLYDDENDGPEVVFTKLSSGRLPVE